MQTAFVLIRAAVVSTLFVSLWVWFVPRWMADGPLVLMLYEEPTLRRLFGSDYDEYCRNVRRWIPTLPRVRQ